MGRDLAWDPERRQKNPVLPPTGRAMARQFLRILRLSYLPFVFLFHPQHPCLVDANLNPDLSWLQLKLNTRKV